MFGTIGGISSLLFTLLNLLIGGFAKFKANNVLANEIYMAERDDADEPDGDAEVKGEVAKQLKQRQNYENGYFVALAGGFCCSPCTDRWACARDCKKKKKEADLAESRIIKEMDIIDFIRSKRLSDFSHKVNHSAHQAYFVGKFRKFCTLYEKFDHVMVDDLKKRVKKASDHDFGAVGYVDEDFTNATIDKMCASLDPTNKYDREIINELLGYSLNATKDGLKDSILNRSEDGEDSNDLKGVNSGLLGNR